MTEIIYAGEHIELAAGQTVLDALLERGHVIPNNCRAGVCQSCLMRAVAGSVPVQAQQGLKDTLKAQNYFLPCCCVPETPLEIVLPAPETVRTTATVLSHQLLNADVLQLRLSPDSTFEYRAGQYVTVWASQQLGRSYSLASVPDLDDYIELHIGRVAGGRMTTWLFDVLKPGDQLQLQMAAGDCFYVPGKPEQNMLLAGTGTGLAPLVGIARDALQQGHSGEIHLIHGAVRSEGLYLDQMLQNMAKQHEHFFYHACVLNGEHLPEHVYLGNIETFVTKLVPKPTNWRVFLCGAADLVNSLKKKIFLAGASMSNIYSDPFISASDVT